jgi:hypothetical protein
MKDLHKAAESLAVGMSRIIREQVSSCLFGALVHCDPFRGDRDLRHSHRVHQRLRDHRRSLLMDMLSTAILVVGVPVLTHQLPAHSQVGQAAGRPSPQGSSGELPGRPHEPGCSLFLVDVHASLGYRPMPKVWNKARGDAPRGAIYCGRGSPWGNPFKLGRDGESGSRFATASSKRSCLISMSVLSEARTSSASALPSAATSMRSSGRPTLPCFVRSLSV